GERGGEGFVALGHAVPQADDVGDAQAAVLDFLAEVFDAAAFGVVFLERVHPRFDAVEAGVGDVADLFLERRGADGGGVHHNGPWADAVLVPLRRGLGGGGGGRGGGEGGGGDAGPNEVATMHDG